MIFIRTAVLLAFASLSWALPNINPQDEEHMYIMANLVNTSANPCEDFYQFACTSGVEFNDNVGVSEVKNLYDSALLLTTHYPISMEGQQDQPQSYGEKIHIYQQSGVDVGKVNLLLFLNEIKPANGYEWPLLLDMEANEEKLHVYMPPESFDINVWEILGNLFSHGLNDVFLTYNKIYLRGKPYIELIVPEPKPIDVMQLGEILIATKLPQNIVEEYYTEIMQTHMEMEALFKQYTSLKKDAIMSYNTLKSDSGALSQLAKFLKQMLPPPARVEDASFYFNLSYMQFLFNKRWQPEEARRLCNYLMVRFLLSLQDTMTPHYSIVSAKAKLSYGLNYIYFKHIVEPYAKELADAFNSTLKPLQRYFTDLVFENHLNLAGRQLQEVTKKINQIHLNIGNIPSNVIESMVEEYYSYLPNMDVNNFYRNELAVRRHAHLEILTCPEEMTCGPTPPGAFYNSDINVISFPFSTLVAPMFSWNWHPVFSMSILGFAAGHEFVHAIDPQSLNNPQITPSFRGDSMKIPKIANALKCLNNQSPTDNIIERLADVVGSQVAFQTYESEFGKQPDFTSTTWQQLYFMSMAQMFCGKGNDQNTNDGHESKKLRLNEIVMNSKKFAETFQCPDNSKMNPKVKCSYI